jgi:hypothetical protein
MKKTLLTIVVIVGFVLTLTGCPNPAGGNNGNIPKKLSMGYLSNFMVDISGATGLGIVKRQIPAGRSRGVRVAEGDTETIEKKLPCNDNR